MKASDIHVKTKELDNFESYERCIEEKVNKLKDIQTMIKNGVADGRCIIGKAHIESHQTEEWGSTLGDLARINPNTMEIKLNTFMSLSLLRAYEIDIINEIKQVASDMKVEEDRFEPVFDKYIQLDKYNYGGWF